MIKLVKKIVKSKRQGSSLDPVAVALDLEPMDFSQSIQTNVAPKTLRSPKIATNKPKV